MPLCGILQFGGKLDHIPAIRISGQSGQHPARMVFAEARSLAHEFREQLRLHEISYVGMVIVASDANDNICRTWRILIEMGSIAVIALAAEQVDFFKAQA